MADVAHTEKPDPSDDFIVSAHALERFQERFPSLWQNDLQASELIYNEVMDALVEGRSSYVAPIELSNHDPDRWITGKALYAWVPHKTRGYVLQEGKEGVLVATVLKGRPTEIARRELYGAGNLYRRREKE